MYFFVRKLLKNVAEPKTAYKLTKRHIISLAECSLSYNGVRYECTIVYIMWSIMNLFILFQLLLWCFSVMFLLLFHRVRCAKQPGIMKTRLTETNASNGVNSVQEMELYTLMNSIETNTRYSRTSERMNDTVVLSNLSKTKKKWKKLLWFQRKNSQ